MINNNELGKNPLVSILIPAYKPDYFYYALESALSQTYENIEVIVSDDSNDNEIKKVVDLLSNGRVKYIKNSPPNGPMYNYVRLFELARGDLIKYLNDDDILCPTCVARMVPFFQHDRVMMVTSRRSYIDANGKPLVESLESKKLLPKDGIIDGRSLATFLLKNQINFIGEPTAFMFRRGAALDISPHLFSFCGAGRERSGLGDVGLSLNLLAKGDCGYITESLSKIRIHPKQWQREAEVRQWALNTWKDFNRLAKGSRLVNKWALGWFLKARLIDNASCERFFPVLDRTLIRHNLGRVWFVRAIYQQLKRFSGKVGN